MQPVVRKRDLTLPQQYLFLSNSGLAPGTGTLTAHKLVWRYQALPSPLGRYYTVRIEYGSGALPSVIVEEPNIKILAGRRDLPHVYHNPLQLCLYMPGTDQWHASKRIDETIVPWTCTWLYYFEEWLVSDEWKGEGKHPMKSDNPEFNRRRRRRFA